MAVSVRNSCKLCAPLGAALAFKGLANSMCLLHGSQGCATYIRRYLISHFREPVDIASSSFTEETAIFGGRANFFESLNNMVKLYRPEVIGIAATCLAETIGENVNGYLKDEKTLAALPYRPEFITVSTPSYAGTHLSGYFAALRAMADQKADNRENRIKLNLFASPLSPADLRLLKELFERLALPVLLLPDYSETLDGGLWQEYQAIPPGGTGIGALRSAGNALASFEFRGGLEDRFSPALLLQERFGVPANCLPAPIGVHLTDSFLERLESILERPVKPVLHQSRARLIDSYVDAHKYVYGKRVLLYGDEESLLSLVSFITETGLQAALCATGADCPGLEHKINKYCRDGRAHNMEVLNAADFENIDERLKESGIDLIIGNSKGYKIASKSGIPFIRYGFPVHDRFGASRITSLLYDGTQALFDRIVNVFIEQRQNIGAVGYTYV